MKSKLDAWKSYLFGNDGKNIFFEDVAIITLKIPYTQDYIQPVCVPKNSNFRYFDDNAWFGQKIWVSGFGYKSLSEPYTSNILQQARLEILDPIQCFWDYGYSDRILTDEKKWAKMKRKGFCAKGKNEEITCPGDSGNYAFHFLYFHFLQKTKNLGPFFAKNKKKYQYP